MSTLHSDILDLGLKQVSDSANWSGSHLSLVVCAGIPASRTEATTDYPTGKRITTALALTTGDVTLQAGTGGRQREVAVAAKAVTSLVGETGQDLHVALYDDTRLLVVTDSTDVDIASSGYLFVVGGWSFGIAVS